MSADRRTSTTRLGLVFATVCLLWPATGCSVLWLFPQFRSATWTSNSPSGGGEPGTKYYILTSRSLCLRPDAWGLKPELWGPGGFSPVTLEQFEVRYGDMKAWPGESVSVKCADGRCTEVALYNKGIIRQRYTFDYRDDGRLRRAVDTAYEFKREGESLKEWAERLKGKTPEVTHVREVEYVWSDDGRTAEVVLASVRGGPVGPSSLLASEIDDAEPGQKLETWRLNDRGQVTSLLRDGKEISSTQYDDEGRFLRCEWPSGGKVENRYDAQGRVVETRVDCSNGEWAVFLYAYPDGPGVELPELAEHGDEAWLITYGKDGRVCHIREHSGPLDDIMANVFEKFKRDKEGRVIWLRVGFVR